ncbi:MAG: transcriptional regulator, LacI family [Clostridia bacterium]|jgi:LacI family transcriptional regulator|nr:transcriptional regulator, LacI family [Clostridia bacterium]
MDKKNITIYDVAKEAGVSASTVSRVISGNVGVSKDAEERVRKAIEKYHFVPNAMAKGLKEKRSKVIGVIVPDIKNPYFSSLFYELQVRAIQEDFMVFLCNTYEDPQIELRMLRTLMNKQVEAMVIIGGALDYKSCENAYINELQTISKKIPLVITTHTMLLDCIKVVNDDKKCMELLVTHLAQKGYQKIALIGGNNNVVPSYDRRRFFLQYIEENRLTTQKEWMIDGGFSIESGIKLMQELFHSKEKPEVVCGINDLVALGALKYAHEHNMRIPEDIGVMGCDGIALGETSYPSLSTIATDYSAFGEEIVNSILSALHNKAYKRLMTIDMKLIARRST